jgi:hypothetical protein
MKEWGKYLLCIAILFSIYILFNTLEEYWMERGRKEVIEYHTNLTAKYIEDFKQQFKKKDELIEKAVQEKLVAGEQHKKDVEKLKWEHEKYRYNIREQFQEMSYKMKILEAQNKNLLLDKQDLQKVIAIYTATNGQLLWMWEEDSKQMFDKYTHISAATENLIREQYMEFIQKIDRVRTKKKRRW